MLLGGLTGHAYSLHSEREGPHPFVEIGRQAALVNDAFARNLPVVAVGIPGNPKSRALKGVRYLVRYLLDPESMVVAGKYDDRKERPE